MPLFVLQAFASPAFGISIVGNDPINGTYSAPIHERFYEGQDKDFLGAPLDLSGVARLFDTQAGNFNQWVSMVSDSYFVSGHSKPVVGFDVTFYREDSLTSEKWEGTVSSSSFIAASLVPFSSTHGLSVGQVQGKFGYSQSPPSWVNRYPLLKRPETYNYLGLEELDLDIYLVGKDHDPNPLTGLTTNTVRVGRNTIDTYDTMKILFSTNEVEFPIDEAITNSGDSDAPSFTLLPSFGAALTGIHLQVGGDASIATFIDDIVAAIPPTESVTVMTDLVGDANADYQVSAQDVSILSGNFGSGPNATYEQGDFNGDGYVNSADVSILSGNFGKSVLSPADFNEDIILDGADFSIIANNWQESVNPGAPGDANGDGIVNSLDIELFDAPWLFASIARPMPLIQIPGDADNSGSVNLTDFNLVHDNQLTSVAEPFTGGDLNGDSYVDEADIEILDDNAGEVFADLTGDRLVDFDDIDFLDTKWEQVVSNGRADGDLNGDNYVDAADLAVLGDWWRFNFFNSQDGYSPSPVPEPGTLVLAGLGLIGVFASRRRNG